MVIRVGDLKVDYYKSDPGYPDSPLLCGVVVVASAYGAESKT